MHVSPGTHLGPYEILAHLGGGGMGEVWRARDTRLGRNVAIKLLSPELAKDSQSKLRLQREARSIAQLNHPHICTLLDVGDEYLVMELVEGPTLVELLSKGPLAMRDVLRHGAEIADALAAAHRAGIVHRDLKPANVMLTKGGAKLLDFGVAQPALANPDSDTLVKITTAGTVVGTLQYMAPEQLAGAKCDARTDLFALGAVLYEMATGRPAFGGESRMAIMTAIIHDEPPRLSQRQPLAPAALDHVIAKCLAKDPEQRWQSAHDVAEELRWCSESTDQTIAVSRKAPRAHPMVAWVAAAAMTLVAGALAWTAVNARRRTAPPMSTVSAINIPEGTEFSLQTIALSRDGTQIVFSARTPGRAPQLWLRSLASDEAIPLPGTDGAEYAFWSPDQHWVGFFARGKLQKVPTSGGPPVEICDAPDARGGTWNGSGTILFGSLRGPLQRVAADGGIPTAVTTLVGSQQSHRWPSFLADGSRFVYLATSSLEALADDDALFGQVLDRAAPPALLAKARSNAAVVDGCLLYASGVDLFARKIDEKTFAVGPSAVVLARGIYYSDSRGSSAFAAAGKTLAYAAVLPSVLRWLARDGSKRDAFLDPAEYRGYFAPCCGDSRVLTTMIDPAQGSTDVWMLDLTRGTKTRLTFSPGNEAHPTWSRNGKHVFYSLGGRVMAKDADNPAAKEMVIFQHPGAVATPFDVSPDGAYLAMRVEAGYGPRGSDIWIAPLRGDGKPFPFISTSFHETSPVFSPDGRFLAYISNASGRNELYVTTFPSRAKQWQVSAGGASGLPIWHRDGTSLFYASPDRRIVSVPVTRAGDELSFGKPALLFDLATFALPGAFMTSSDGTRILFSERPVRSGASPLILVQNWNARLPPVP